MFHPIRGLVASGQGFVFDDAAFLADSDRAFSANFQHIFNGGRYLANQRGQSETNPCLIGDDRPFDDDDRDSHALGEAVVGDDCAVEGDDGKVEGDDGKVEGDDGKVEGDDGKVEGNDRNAHGDDQAVESVQGEVEGNDRNDLGDEREVIDDDFDLVSVDDGVITFKRELISDDPRSICLEARFIRLELPSLGHG